MTASPSEPVPVTQALSRFVGQAAHAELPADVAHAARRAFINWIGCALGGATDASARTVLRVALASSGRSEASVLGRPERLDRVNAALVNGVAANALDYDDMHVPTLIHPTGPVAAAAFAAAEHAHASGERLLRAIACGIEIECRLGLALFPAHYDAGWHSTSTLGTLGAAAATAVVLGLDATQCAHAFGIAATQASGLRAMLSNPCKSFNIGQAASRGLLSALLAQAGLESAPDVLEARHGLFQVYAQPLDPARLLDGLGTRYLVTEVSLKPYPCGVVIHPLIDAALRIAEDRLFDAGQVRAISAHVNPRALDLADRRHPDSALTGRFSLQHAAALALTRGAAGLDAFDAADVNDPLLVALRDRIDLLADLTLDSGQARLAVTLIDGTRIEHVIERPSGSPARPLSDTQLRAKFMELARRSVSAAAAERLHALCERLPELPDCAALVV